MRLDRIDALQGLSLVFARTPVVLARGETCAVGRASECLIQKKGRSAVDLGEGKCEGFQLEGKTRKGTGSDVEARFVFCSFRRSCASLLVPLSHRFHSIYFFPCFTKFPLPTNMCL
jgi:hypothetical protein